MTASASSAGSSIAGGAGLSEAVAGLDRLLHGDDQRIGHALVDLEDEQHAVALVGQADGYRAVAGGVDGRGAVAPQREHMAALDGIALR